MQRALPKKLGFTASIRNAGGAVYLKTKIGVSFPFLHGMGNPSTAPPYVSIGIKSVFILVWPRMSDGASGGYCGLLGCGCRMSSELTPLPVKIQRVTVCDGLEYSGGEW